MNRLFILFTYILNICKKDLLGSYDISNNSNYIYNDNSLFCKLSNSCCSNKMEEIWIYDWVNIKKDILIENYEYSLKYLKALINTFKYFQNKGKNVAKFESSNPKCFNLSNKIISINYSKEGFEYFIQKLIYEFKYLANVRKGVFCLLCDQNFHKNVDLKNKEYILSYDFCEELVKETIEVSKIKIDLIYPFLNIINGLSSCNIVL